MRRKILCNRHVLGLFIVTCSDDDNRRYRGTIACLAAGHTECAGQSVGGVCGVGVRGGAPWEPGRRRHTSRPRNVEGQGR